MTDCVYFLLYLALGKLSLMLLINYYYYYIHYGPHYLNTGSIRKIVVVRMRTVLWTLKTLIVALKTQHLYDTHIFQSQ